MPGIQKFIAFSLLVVFAWAVLPMHTIHQIFADHNDTDPAYCIAGDAPGGQVEQKHVHCEILKTNSPVYWPQAVVNIESELGEIISEIQACHQLHYISSHNLTHSVRGPPQSV
jgi:hypothetical protein